jgi:hypothetical protein
LRLTDHLDVPERKIVGVTAEVEVIQAGRLLEDGRFSSRDSASTASLAWNM